MACDPATLVDQARCIQCNVPPGAQLPVLIYLFCQILAGQGGGGGGGGGAGQIVAYSVAPPANPADVTKPAIAYDPAGLLATLGWSVAGQAWV